MTRLDERNSFIKASGYEDAQQHDLPADASARSYHRLVREGQSVMLMDDPSQSGDIQSFVRLGQHLSGLGLSTPEILSQDLENGFLLLEDFGDSTFRNLLASGHDERELYRLAVEVLAHLHEQPGSSDVTVPPYDLDFMMMEVGLLTDWYWPEVKGCPCSGEIREEYIRAWKQVHASLPNMPEELVIRDFHVDNLMLLPGRIGIAACGVLDFQSALMGRAAYDLMSLLEDARRDVPRDLVADMLNHYFALRPDEDRTKFMAWFDFLGAQRHAKILGGFMRTYRRDAKDGYLKYMPRVTGQLEAKLTLPSLAPVSDWFNHHMPEIFA